MARNPHLGVMLSGSQGFTPDRWWWAVSLTGSPSSPHFLPASQDLQPPAQDFLTVFSKASTMVRVRTMRGWKQSP